MERRLTWVAGVLAAVVILLVYLFHYLALQNLSFFTGWTVFGLLFFSLLFNLRKKLPHPPLLSSATWLRAHVALGGLSVFVFVLHVQRWPDSGFEWFLAVLFVLVALSGMLGLLLSQRAPRRLTLLRQEVIFEQIPEYALGIKKQAEKLMIHAAASSKDSILPDFYSQHLAGYFQVSARTWGLPGSQRRGKALLHALAAKRRYLDQNEVGISAELGALIETRTRLDQHALWQGWLKLWLFVHIPLSYGLLVFVIYHLIVVHAYAMGSA